jgi:nucleotide-binding universal stress UspA family protein
MSMSQMRQRDSGPPRSDHVEQRSVVVAGVDGSLEAAEAAQYAALAADARGLDLLVVHAYAPPPGATGLVGLFAAEAAQRVADDALTQIRMPVGLQVHTEVERTTPGALLMRLSRSAALVTLGQHAFDVADQLVEGSVAGPLAVTAGCPVVVVPRGWSRATRRARTVAVALDGTNSAEAVLDFAFAEAERQQSPVVALHALARGEVVGSVDAEVRDLEEILAAAKESHPDLTLSVRLVGGDVAQAILDASAGVRLMVVGRPHRTGLGAVWRRSVTQAVLATARCPLVVVA